MLRFDLFRGDPHFHIPAGTQKPTGHLDPADDTLAVALDRIASDLPGMLREAGAAEHAGSVEAFAMEGVIEQLRSAARDAPAVGEPMRIELTPEVKAAIGL